MYSIPLILAQESHDYRGDWQLALEEKPRDQYARFPNLWHILLKGMDIWVNYGNLNRSCPSDGGFSLGNPALKWPCLLTNASINQCGRKENQHDSIKVCLDSFIHSGFKDTLCYPPSQSPPGWLAAEFCGGRRSTDLARGAVAGGMALHWGQPGRSWQGMVGWKDGKTMKNER